MHGIAGLQGGYQLARSREKISVRQMGEALGETLEPLSPLAANVRQPQGWVTFILWNLLHKKLTWALSPISLE